MKIQEMTMRGPELSNQAEEFGSLYKERWLANGKHIGDIEKYKVILDDIYYSLWDDDLLVAYCSLDEDNTVDDAYVHPDYRGKKIFSMMLWFFKTRLNRSPLTLGYVHSKMMQEVVKGMSRFKKYWHNTKTGEDRPFELDTLDDFYSYLGPTSWHLVLENSSEFDWPMFGGRGFIKESYYPFID